MAASHLTSAQQFPPFMPQRWILPTLATSHPRLSSNSDSQRFSASYCFVTAGGLVWPLSTRVSRAIAASKSFADNFRPARTSHFPFPFFQRPATPQITLRSSGLGTTLPTVSQQSLGHRPGTSFCDNVAPLDSCTTYDDSLLACNGPGFESLAVIFRLA
jgi:hypothetical protein